MTTPTCSGSSWQRTLASTSPSLVKGRATFLVLRAWRSASPRSSELLGPDATVHITDVLASDSRAAVLFEVRDRGTRGSCAQRVAVYRLSRGRITEIRVHQEPSGALNA